MEKLRKSFYKFYWTIQKVIVPGLLNSQYAYKDKITSYVNQNSRWLELGCGHQILPEWMRDSKDTQATLARRSKMLVGVDLDFESLKKNKLIRYKVVGDIAMLPFKASSFDLVTNNMVVEHIENPTLTLAELYRMLMPNGVFIFHTPNILSYQSFLGFLIPEILRNKLIFFLEGRKEEDVFPVYYRMNTPKKIKNIAKKTAFNILNIDLVDSSAITVMLGPIVIVELILIRLLRFKLFRNFRSNIIAVLQKDST